MDLSAFQQVDIEIQEEMSRCYYDPLRFVKFAYPWGEPGPLRDLAGPDRWQKAFLEELGDEVKARRFDGVHPVQPIRMTRSSGHGIGKGVLSAWLADWIMSTRPNAQGTVTANTSTQLDTKTWAAIQRWTKLLINAHWFEVTSERMWLIGAKESWFCTPQTCREENSEAFAGQHAAQSTSFYIFDEGSAVPDKIYDVAEGGLTDGEPMIFVFGNPTRNSGKFHRINFGAERNRWKSASIDSRDCEFPNKAQIAEWIEDYGDDSDFVRVRVKGLPPRASDLQFIDAERVQEAKARETPPVIPGEPLIMGIDVARGGMDSNVVRFRRGRDARTIPPIRIPGQLTRDTMLFVSKIADLIAQHRPDACFLDSTGVGGPVGDRLRQLGYKIVDVNFGGQAPDRHYANQRAYMWGKMKDWLQVGAIDTQKNDKNGRLELDLTGPLYAHDKQSRLILEPKEKMKDRGLDSPDDGDALALTFAQPVAPTPLPRAPKRSYSGAWS